MLIGGVLALLAVAVFVQSRTTWYPQADLAMTELHVRDVAGSHRPLLGLVGRIGTENPSIGAHPGPLSFYALWPFYRLLGAKPWALLGAAACLHVVATGTALWIALRRGGLQLALGVCALIVAIMSYLGPSLMTQPWNPYMPLLWWLVFALSVWSVTCGDIALLPIAAFSGSFCVQAHVSFAALVAVGVLIVVVTLPMTWIHADRRDRIRILGWFGAALATSIIVWLPPIYQQLTSREGNLALIIQYFAHPPMAPIGLRQGLNLMLVHLNPWAVISSRNTLITTGSTLPGAAIAALWIFSVVVAWRLHARTILRLHALIALTLAAGIWSMSRIFGVVWYYDVLWAWCVGGLLVVALVMTLAVAAERYVGPAGKSLFEKSSTPALVLTIIFFSALFLHDALHVQVPPNEVANATVGRLVTSTRVLLHKRGGTHDGAGKRFVYVVTQDDPILFGSHSYALVDYLDRAGYDVRMYPGYEQFVGSQRVIDLDDANGILHIAVGATDIRHWQEAFGTVEIVVVDPATPRERQRFNELRDRVRSQLAAARLNRLATLIDKDLFLAMTDSEMPSTLLPAVHEMGRIGLPEAVFLAPIIHANSSTTAEARDADDLRGVE